MACEPEKNLKGHSGCLLQIIRKDGQFAVRKQSASDSYNRRLRTQCAKQKLYDRYSHSNIFTPKIRGTGYHGHLFYFDMDFVHCKNLSEMLPFLPTPKICHLISELFLHINTAEKKICPGMDALFRKKIAGLSQTVPPDSLKKECFSLLDSYDFSEVERSICHGDLTLENILVTDDYHLYLIDFLDSFCNSYLIDVAKLFQDLELGWSYRHRNSDTTREIRLLIAKDHLLQQLAGMPDGEHRIVTIYHILLLNVLRIYPYTGDQDTLTFLDNSCEKIMKIIGDLK